MELKQEDMKVILEFGLMQTITRQGRFVQWELDAADGLQCMDWHLMLIPTLTILRTSFLAA